MLFRREENISIITSKVNSTCSNSTWIPWFEHGFSCLKTAFSWFDNVCIDIYARITFCKLRSPTKCILRRLWNIALTSKKTHMTGSDLLFKCVRSNTKIWRNSATSGVNDLWNGEMTSRYIVNSTFNSYCIKFGNNNLHFKWVKVLLPFSMFSIQQPET